MTANPAGVSARLILIKTAAARSGHFGQEARRRHHKGSRLTEEALMQTSNSRAAALATRNDVKGILGDIDAAEMLAIMALKPTIADIEEASVWLDGDPDVFGAGKTVQGVASEIVAILTEDEEEEPPRAG
jgi:Asp-tRNA(Asn)/Glu-tRNA(Gln) amidotransferase A subunit family amidase